MELIVQAVAKGLICITGMPQLVVAVNIIFLHRKEKHNHHQLITKAMNRPIRHRLHRNEPSHRHGSSIEASYDPRLGFTDSCVKKTH